MAEPFLSEIRMMSFNFAPNGWALCNGQQLPINQNQALFSLLGTTFGGNGQTTFGLPNLQGKVPIHTGGGFTLGQTGGEQSHTVTSAELPTHTHALQATSSNGSAIIPTGNLLAGGTPQPYHAQDGNVTAMNPASVANVGGSQAHQNMKPFLALNFSIALQGIFPSPN